SVINQSRPQMSGNGGNLLSLRDLPGTYEKSGLVETQTLSGSIS
ncbi:hypothetical protein ACSSVV_002169, partial [Marinobacter sp. MBR-105]